MKTIFELFPINANEHILIVSAQYRERLIRNLVLNLLFLHTIDVLIDLLTDISTRIISSEQRAGACTATYRTTGRRKIHIVRSGT